MIIEHKRIKKSVKQDSLHVEMGENDLARRFDFEVEWMPSVRGGREGRKRASTARMR